MRRAILMLAFAGCVAAPPLLAQQAATAAPAVAPVPHKQGPFGRAMADFTRMLRDAGSQQTRKPAPAPAPTTATPATPATLGDDAPVPTAPPSAVPSAQQQPAPPSTVAQQARDARGEAEPPTPAVVADADTGVP